MTKDEDVLKHLTKKMKNLRTEAIVLCFILLAALVAMLCRLVEKI